MSPHRTLRSFFTLLTLSVLCCLSPAYAQTDPNLEVGIKPFGSYDVGDIDSVSLSNFNLMLRIPLLSYPQRGALRGDVYLSYNAKGWSVHQTCFNQSCEDHWAWNPQPGGVSFGFDLGPSVSGGVIPGSPNIHAYTAYTSDGSSHLMTPGNGGYESLDGSGIWWNGQITNQFARLRSGNQSTYINNNPSLVDTNGNWETNTGLSSQADTLGRNLIPSQQTNTTDYTGCVQPAVPNAINSAYTVNYPGPNGANRVMKVCSATYSLATNFKMYDYNCPCPITEGSTSESMIVSVVLYNGTSWATSPAWGFDYVSRDTGDPSTVNYGDLTKITLPTSGTISYTWGTIGVCLPGNSTVGVHTPVSRGVSKRSVDANDGNGPRTWTYTFSGTTVTDPNGNDTVHTFTDLNSGTCTLYETQTQWFQGSSTSGTLLKTVKTDYISKPNPFETYLFNAGLPYPNVNVLPIRTTTIWPNGLTTKVEKDYDTNLTNGLGTYSYGSVIAVREYDYGNNSPGPLIRSTTNTYQAFSNSAYLSANLLDLLSTQTIKDGNGSQVAKTTFSYDGSSLQASGITTQHDNTKAASPRGNRTSVCRWLNTTGANICSSTTYYDTGMPYQVIDPLSNTTTLHYSSTYDGAYLTQTNLPDTGSPAAHHVTSGTYDFNTGQLTAYTDQNSKTRSYQYDLLGRMTTASFPDTGQTTFTYPNLVTISTTKKMTSTASLSGTTLFDGLGRVSETQLNSDPDCPSSDKTDTTYDPLGRVHTISNPYCSTSDPTYGLTTYAYDALGRTTQVTQPDGNTVLTSYTGRASQVQDEGNGSQRVARISQADGLGRLASVCEVTSASQLGSGGTPAACGQDISATGFLTTYGYDTLSNLTSVSQSGLNGRTFQYDSLSRPTSATNPESGTISYTYDNNSNVLTKTDARSIKITYSYDALNRLTGKTYSDSTPAATFNYDQTSALGVTLTNTIGRSSSESTGGSLPTGSVFSYDSMGRILDNSQCTPQNCGTSVFALQYPQYDFLGDLISGTNAAGVTFTYSYNGAARLTSITSNFVDASHPGTLFSSAHYAPFGPLTSSTLGNSLNESISYDKRLREQSYSATSGSTTRFSFTITSFAPNGDILAANDSVNGNWTYSYDPFNRLSGSNQNSGQAVYSYVYDRFGNRWQQNGPHSMQLSFSGSNNRMDGHSYDAAGNVSNDGSHSYFYDAENRLVQVDGTLGNCSTATACYTYDAEGRRVRKATASGTLDFLYDAQGHKVAEVDNTGTFQRGELYADGRHFAVFAPDPGPTGATFFIHSDWLGTDRARTNMSGTACETITSLPFGDAQTISDTCGDSAGDVSPMHFTGKERDSESGLDNFGARYDSSQFGRFMSPDAFYKDSHVGEPQSWNEYAYVRNNPLRLTDPTGQLATQTTTCTTDPQGHSTCNVRISATIAIYAQPGSNLDQSQLNAAANTIKSSIELSWTGSYTDAETNTTYNVSTQVNVQVTGSENEAMKSGAQNVIGLSNGPADPEHGGDSYVNLGSLTGPDTGVWNYNTLSTENTAGHEFTHLLGTDDTYGLGVLSDTEYSEDRPLQATEYDLRKGIFESVRDSSFARSILRACNGQCAAASASNRRITNTTQVGAPLLPFWWK